MALKLGWLFRFLQTRNSIRTQGKCSKVGLCWFTFPANARWNFHNPLVFPSQSLFTQIYSQVNTIINMEVCRWHIYTWSTSLPLRHWRHPTGSSRPDDLDHSRRLQPQWLVHTSTGNLGPALCFLRSGQEKWFSSSSDLADIGSLFAQGVPVGLQSLPVHILLLQ